MGSGVPDQPREVEHRPRPLLCREAAGHGGKAAGIPRDRLPHALQAQRVGGLAGRGPEGAHRLGSSIGFFGEFAFGNNAGIQRGIQNILFDEKIGGTIHMALGNSYRECGGKNTSQLHWDMICDLRPEAGGGEVWVDGELLLKDGKLVLKP